MAPTLGKRKRVTRDELERPSKSPSPSSDSQESDGEDVQALFRKAFEARFKPLDIEPVHKKAKEVEVEEDDEEEEESDWSGISPEDEENKVEIFDYATDTRPMSEKASKAEMKAFMSSKPPTLSALMPAKPPTKAKKADDADPAEASHLRNDLALQSLLRESTLLSTDNPTYSTRGATPSTKPSSIATRHKLTDLHLQSLGAKGSIFTEKKMPMSERKGIVAKAKLREDLRRKEARENGIILERPKKESAKTKSGRDMAGKRDMGVGAPSVGKFRNGTLTLSRQDVHSITRDGGGSRGGRGKGKRGRGRR